MHACSCLPHEQAWSCMHTLGCTGHILQCQHTDARVIVLHAPTSPRVGACSWFYVVIVITTVAFYTLPSTSVTQQGRCLRS